MKEKYFHAMGNRKWVFGGDVEGKVGKQHRVHLFYAHSVPIRRHTKVKGAANSYDPTWEPYFETRLGVSMAGTLKGRRQLLFLWKEQDGICPVCDQKITNLTGWDNHHVVWRVDGGSNRAENRVLMHPNCHRQVHSQRLNVVKSRSTPSV